MRGSHGLSARRARRTSSMYILQNVHYPTLRPRGSQTPSNAWIWLIHIPQMLAVYIQYKYIHQNMYIPKPCAQRAQGSSLTDILLAGYIQYLYIFVLDTYMLPTFGKYLPVEFIYWYWIYPANNWGIYVSWRFLCALRAQGWEINIFRYIYLWWMC